MPILPPGRSGVAIFAAIIAAAPIVAAEPGKPELVSVRKIWDQAPHNAFTDLIRWRGRWYCVFREGKAHVSPDGSLRVITSADGETWESAALITSPTADLRDAKITVAPDGRLMLGGAGALHQPAAAQHQSLVWFTEDGRNWSDGIPIGDPDMWLWRATWNRGVCYNIGYNTNPARADRFIRLYHSRDGAKWETLADRIFPGPAGEHSLLFLNDGTAYCLLRRDVEPFTGQFGVAKPPYKEWTWKDVGCRIGGPHWVRLPDGRILAAVRLHDGRVRTGLCWVDPDTGKLTECLTLPSGGDTSYAGLVLHEGLLWMSYYSSHEGKTSIYLAKVRL